MKRTLTVLTAALFAAALAVPAFAQGEPGAAASVGAGVGAGGTGASVGAGAGMGAGDAGAGASAETTTKTKKHHKKHKKDAAAEGGAAAPEASPVLALRKSSNFLNLGSKTRGVKTSRVFFCVMVLTTTRPIPDTGRHSRYKLQQFHLQTVICLLIRHNPRLTRMARDWLLLALSLD